MLKNKLISLLCCLMMMCAAALCVNRTILGISSDTENNGVAAGDTITVTANGSTVIHSRFLTDVPGYAGPVPLDIYVSPTGEIDSIVPLENAESPMFFSRATTLLQKYVGLTPEEASNMKADAISGATYSSQALIANVNAASAYYLSNPTRAARPETPWKMWIALIVTLSACIVPLFVKNRIYSNVQLIANVAVLGFWCSQFLDYALMLKYLSSGISVPAGLTAICMLIAAFVYPLFGRSQHYCNHICPLGSAQLLVAQLCGYKIRLTPSTVKALDWFRKILWAALMLMLWADVATWWMDLELFRAFIPQSASWGILTAAALFVGLSAVVSRPYCRFVCPTGSLFKRAENIG